jgi:hypothetical protein
MNDQQLEAVLRRSLARHAATIESGPQWPLPEEDLPVSVPRHGRSWWPVAAAVAAVLAVIGIVVAVRHITSDRHEPATPVIVTRSACTIDPPPAWQHAIEAAGRRNLGQLVLGGAPDGTILVRREAPTTDQTVLVSPSGATRIVQQMPFPGRYGVATNSMIDSRWIVLPIGDIRADVPTLLDFDVFDRATLQLTEKVPITKGSRIGTWALFNGHLYWTQPRSGSIGSLFDHDLAARTTRTAEPYGVQNLLASPNGVAWTDAQHRTHLLGGAAPDQIPGQPGTHPGLVTDGRSYAWPSGSSITWHNTATKRTVMVRWFPRFQVTVVAVAGPYVLINSEYNQSRSSRLIDTRTGAAATVPFQSSGSVASGNGVLALSENPLVVLHVDQLPPITC